MNLTARKSERKSSRLRSARDEMQGGIVQAVRVATATAFTRNLSLRGTSAHTGDVAIRPPEALKRSEGATRPQGETDCHANAAALARNDVVGSASQKVKAIPHNAARADSEKI